MVAAAAAVYHYYSIVTYYRCRASELTVLLILYRTKAAPLSPRAAHCLGRRRCLI